MSHFFFCGLESAKGTFGGFWKKSELTGSWKTSWAVGRPTARTVDHRGGPWRCGTRSFA